ncbi:MAG: beta-class carbonic anhydrase [Candidatus Hodarchaeota archaeon]
MELYDLDEKFKIWQNIKFYFPYGELTIQPLWRVAILTCMDCRIISSVFGFEEPGNVIIIRNAGAILTFDSLRSLLIAIYELNVNLIVVVGHSDCGGEMTREYMSRLLAKISKKTRISGEQVLNLLSSSDSSDAFLGFDNIEVQINQTVKTIQEHPLISPANVEVVGYIYNVSKGVFSKVHHREHK